MKEIDRLEREAVMDKMGELGNLNCSLQVMTMIIMMMFVMMFVMMMILQFWEPVRSLGHTRDLQEIELLAVNAKNLIYKVSLQMLKTVDCGRLPLAQQGELGAAEALLLLSQAEETAAVIYAQSNDLCIEMLVETRMGIKRISNRKLFR